MFRGFVSLHFPLGTPTSTITRWTNTAFPNFLGAHCSPVRPDGRDNQPCVKESTCSLDHRQFGYPHFRRDRSCNRQPSRELLKQFRLHEIKNSGQPQTSRLSSLLRTWLFHPCPPQNSACRRRVGRSDCLFRVADP